ncbi:MAG: hypothetical protein ABJD07_17725 [Gemmatimonadaceae bacterium]
MAAPAMQRDAAGLACRASFAMVDGIACFDSPDPFYDRYADVHGPFRPRIRAR